jgi:hypothetical protein
MPGCPVLFMVIPHVRSHHPLHEPAQAPLFLRDQHQMEMVRHQAVGVHLYRLPLLRRFDQIEKVVVISIVVKNLHPHISTVDDMKNTTDRFASRYSWHFTPFSFHHTNLWLNVACPLFLSPIFQLQTHPSGQKQQKHDTDEAFRKAQTPCQIKMIAYNKCNLETMIS